MNLSKQFTIHLASCLILLIGCQKNTMNQELYITNSKTGVPVKCKVILEYSFSGQSALHEKELGITDENGYIHIDEGLRGYTNCHLKIYSLEGHYSGLFSNGLAKTIPVKLGKKGKMDIKLDPYYFYLLTLKNVNCQNNDDSLWLSYDGFSSLYTHIFTGCIDTTLYFNYYGQVQNWTDNIPSSTHHFHVKVKRNGLITENDENFELVENEITPVLIEY